MSPSEIQKPHPNPLSTAPRTNQGGKWRLAYYQGGNYIDYTVYLRTMVAALSNLGWIEPVDFSDFLDCEDAEIIWQHLTAEVQSDYLEFLPGAYWSAAWDEHWRTTMCRTALQRLAASGDIDLVIAMGTWAGQDLATDRHRVPTLAVNSSDPIEAGILKSVADPGYDHVLVEIDPQRYRRQMRRYHEILGFERLGVVLDNTKNGRVFANLADLETVAQECGFSLVLCHAADDAADEQASLQAVTRCYTKLAPQIDALWIGFHIGEQPKFMPHSLETILAHQIPTMTAVGPSAVERGVLLSSSYLDFEWVGHWAASKMTEIFNGALPSSLNRAFEMPGKLLVNTATAHQIRWEVPKDILSNAGRIYEAIEGFAVDEVAHQGDQYENFAD